MSNSTQTVRQSVLVVGLGFGLIRVLNQAFSERPLAFGILRKTSWGNKEKELREAVQRMSGGEGPW